MAKVGKDIGVLYEPAGNSIVLFRKINGTELDGK
jgi:hypothetical protein